MAKVFKEQQPGESLDKFSERKVSPTESETKKFGEHIDKFVSFLHDKPFGPDYSVKEVRKCGSLGKGTAVRGRADIDLVVIINGLDSIDDLKKHRVPLLESLKKKLEKSLGIQPENLQVNKYMYSLTYKWNGIEVDILPAVDILSACGSLSGIYEAMKKWEKPEDAAQQFSASLSPLQLEFVKEVPEYVKKVIRLAKLWNKENQLEIRSCSLELLTISVWRSNGGENPGTDKLFRDVMTRLANFETIQVAFDKHYNTSSYTKKPPYILDPANPLMNTLHGRPKTTHEVSTKAWKALKSMEPLKQEDD